MAYATVADVQSRMETAMTEAEQSVCATLLDDAAVIIDAVAALAGADAKKVVSCRMVIRAMGDSGADSYPTGATQGSISALGYSQSWTIGSGGGTGELYLAKLERQILGAGNNIGTYSPVEGLVVTSE